MKINTPEIIGRKLEHEEGLHKHQFRYREQRSAETQSMTALKLWKILEKNKIIMLISFDRSGAFDKIKWSAILKCLGEINIGNIVY